MNKEEIKSRLQSGNNNFAESRLESKKQDVSRRNELTEGQNPFAIILSCADSRVVPELIFDTGIGELFVIRVAGNIANKSTIASIEYAVAHLKTKLIVVLSHENCGAVTAAVAGGDNGDNLNHLLEHIAPAIKQSANNQDINTVSKLNASLTAQNLVKDSVIIRDAVKSEQVEILPAYYNLKSGKVDFT
jgi:carbonic anhydrase